MGVQGEPVMEISTTTTGGTSMLACSFKSKNDPSVFFYLLHLISLILFN